MSLFKPLRRRGRGFWLGCLLLAQAMPLWAAPALKYDLKGLDGALEDNVEIYLAQLPSVPLDGAGRYQDEIETAVREALQALGYYQPEIRLGQVSDGQLPITIDAGEPVRYRDVSYQIEGDAKDDELFQALLENLPVKKGEVLRHDQYESSKSRLLSLALQRGYFDAQLTLARVEVRPEQQAADVIVHFASGPRYRYGPLSIDSDRELDGLLDPLLTLEEGDFYQASAVSELNRSLSSTKYFRTVEVIPLVDKADDEHRIPLTLRLRAKADNQVELGIGASSDEGPRGSVSWTKPFLNKYGHSLTTELKVSAPRQEATFEYRMPRGDPINEFYSLQGGYQYLNQEDTESQQLTFALHRWDKRTNDWSRDLFIRTLYESYTQADQDDDVFLLIPGVSFNRTRVRGGLETTWGDSQQITLELSEPGWGSDSRFVRLWGRSKWLRSLGENGRIIARAEQGAVWVNNVDQLPPSLRFFTGGDQTVRGFAYRTIAPRNEDGDLVGGKYSTALSLEYDHRVADKWRLAGFVDGGTATNSYASGLADWKVSTGFGVRWMTPIGPIRLDLAFGVSETHVPWRLHFTMGPEL
ncbi:autotransporter assembly complex protein TamA [Gallaecimonas xiamenensis]|uniref:Translocation and assembly module subunit TamA n=1 Tax=Gallaecimonas xiamenensis 3-C-1 TaxID=745411 RepID=K2J2F3_9GAMM|nr:autotransporter assembly complex family protein [Gallaecimonas xiamenensis]EKE69243.1 outer membrane protein [Gallaecimonas xiamenensis 3-C-1]